MAKEIERKFLVDAEKWKSFKLNLDEGGVSVQQAYIGRTEKQTSRIRIKQFGNQERAYFTIKGNTRGITRTEYEYEIPVEDAKAMIAEFCDKFISKRRFTFPYKNKVWEVDEFYSPKPDLILAEVELNSEDEECDYPDFITVDVSTDPQYFNVNML